MSSRRPKPSLGVCALAVACLVSCASGEPVSEPVEVSSSPIQGGTTDSVDTFAVGIMQTSDLQNSMVAFCTGVLLAPNLVATARHCVAQLSSSTIDCSTSTFGAVLPVTDVFVTTDTTIQPLNASRFVDVSSIIVPTGANSAYVCGNDLALLILSESISVPQYVLPTINPPMTDPMYQTTVTAIGYGVDTPTDTKGTSAGTRRIKEDVPLGCIPNDSDPNLDCYSDPTASMYITTSEFMSGDSTCEGDSGSGAFEQGNFDVGKWVSFGVLSRGGTSADMSTCIQPIYSRFDAWGPLLVSAAKQAAKAGNYTAPAWATASSAAPDAGTTVGKAPVGDSGVDASQSGGASGQVDASDDQSSNSMGSVDGTPCTSGSTQCLNACVPSQSGGSYVCASACLSGYACANGLTCAGSYCVPIEGATKASSGCSASNTGTIPAGWLSVWALGFSGAAVGRRRRRLARHVSAS